MMAAALAACQPAERLGPAGGGKAVGSAEPADAEELPADEIAARNEAYLQTNCPLVTDDAPLELQIECQDFSGRAPPPNCSGVTPPDRGPFGRKIAITFDDGPALGRTDAVLDLLRDVHPNVKATFFINGSRVKASTRPLLDRMLLEGHLIANHTTDHVDASKYKPAGAFKMAQVDDTDDEIRDAHTRAGVALPAFLFWRFPYGATNCEINDVVMQQAGYQITGWHIDTADWCFNSKKGGVGHCDRSTFKWVPDTLRDDFPGYAVQQAESHGGGVLLMHDVHQYTVESLDALLTALEAHDFGFVRLDDATYFPKLNDGVGIGEPEPADPSETPFTGASCRDLSADGLQDYSGYACVDVSHPNFGTGACDGAGNTVSSYCPGNWAIKCCINPAAY